ncbi:hypothetical protein ACGFI9_21955 [Micromonospora sp. NPDC048930]|uniref:hypothetical protein n=1 Tax=Micromonospora sp. NPDC048930 TaxID=3364261 RepID=UPI00371ADF80
MALDTVVVVDHDTYWAHRDDLDAWVIDHGLNGRLMPLPGAIWIADGQVTVEQYVRGQHGLLCDVHGEPVRTTRTVPLRRPLPLPECCE